MAVSNNTLKMRIQSKNDTEANWNKLGPNSSSPFVPLHGEIIIYLPDNTHDYTRLKVGDGSTNVVSLPFIDAGSINGEKTVIQEYLNFSSFPQPGSPHKLYIDLETNQIYYFDSSRGYILLIGTQTAQTSRITWWGPGAPTQANIEDNILKITNGTAPLLAYNNVNAVSGLVIGGNNA